MITQREKYNVFVNELKNKIDNQNKKIIFLCIGTNKVIGDSFGPLVGTNLEHFLKYNNKVAIFGNINNPLNALNIKEKLIYINKTYIDKYIIAIDSAVSDKNFIGDIFVTKNKMILGKGLNKEIFSLGDISIKCSVCINEYNKISNFKCLNNVSKTFVQELANLVSIGIYEVISTI